MHYVSEISILISENANKVSLQISDLSISVWQLNYKYYMYRRQHNTLNPKGGRFCKNNVFKFLIGSQPIIERRSLICGRRC